MAIRDVVRPAARRFKDILRASRPVVVDQDSSAAALNPWGLPGLLEHPDGYLRHMRLAAAVLGDHGSGTVLNVGDPFCQLHGLLPEFEVTSTDLGPSRLVPAGARFLQADFTEPGAFGEGSFDLVCSTDVFEHIPPQRRRAFIEAALRVARRSAYIAFPAGRDAAIAEEIIRCTRSRVVFRDALEEHASHGLPQLAELEQLLTEIGCDFEVRPLTTVVEWLTSFLMCPGDWERPELVRAYWRFLDGTAPELPGPGPVYRYLVVARS
jgi:SAM-dependent methyltransferase